MSGITGLEKRNHEQRLPYLVFTVIQPRHIQTTALGTVRIRVILLAMGKIGTGESFPFKLAPEAAEKS